MKFDWSSYLEVAEILLNEVNTSWGQGDNVSLNEAKIRSSISRAYYSSFCLVRNYLRDVEGYSELINMEKKQKEKKKNVHQYIIHDILLISTNTNFVDLGKDLRNLRKLRNDADYEDEIPFHTLRANAIKALKYAKTINTLLEKIKNNKLK
ncbi:DNA-binding protein [Sphaerospermopsis sp. FACHB-1094]|uniref:DNA-binding protein n=1 Tax=Sphaerospermopsis sp. FACHB-1094 TaxID=2692861 RepID=UPI00168243F6|nr:DNA-binding protein [Sphaerospermopsis sp. FACHB-1094]MBD2133418.1 DNA-binding protein [Sphaerospermopsis sp. FACHB-1094]